MGSLTSTEQMELLAWFQEAVRIPSINPPGAEGPMETYLCGILDAEGIAYEVVPVASGRADIIATLPGQRENAPIIFTGHMDVVTVSEEERTRWAFDPFAAEIQDGLVYGRGTADMKSGLIASLYAMVRLHRAGIVPPQTIYWVATVDEEDSMLGVKALLSHPKLCMAKACVICEPTEMTLCHRGKGRTYASITVAGRTAHGSLPAVGENAIYQAMDVIAGIRDRAFPTTVEEGNQTFWRVLEIQAGVPPMVVPDQCTFTIDARVGTDMDSTSVWAELDEVLTALREKHPGLEVSYEVLERREPWVTPLDNPLVALAADGIKDCGMKPIYTLFPGSTDGNYFHQMGTTNLIVGPGDLACVHRENEHIAIDSLYQAVNLYEYLMKRYTGI